MRHGLNKRFSCQGIQIVIEYFKKLGHTVMAFMPDYYMNYEKIGKYKSAKSLGFEIGKAKLPDNISLLNKMVEAGDIIATPPQDYDDSYCIKYAISHKGCIVSNDLYRDAVDDLKRGGKKVFFYFFNCNSRLGSNFYFVW